MEVILHILQSYGYWGMGIGSFLAGSVFPFSSEAVMVGLLLTGMSPGALFLSATIGNVGGSMFNYWVGTFGRLEWIERYLHIPSHKVERTQKWLENRGAWIGALCFLPILGSVLSVTLGYMRANPWISFISISIGKALRYGILIYVTLYFRA